jgi:hypothetical protein
MINLDMVGRLCETGSSRWAPIARAATGALRATLAERGVQSTQGAGQTSAGSVLAHAVGADPHAGLAAAGPAIKSRPAVRACHGNRAPPERHPPAHLRRRNPEASWTQQYVLDLESGDVKMVSTGKGA